MKVPLENASAGWPLFTPPSLADRRRGGLGWFCPKRPVEAGLRIAGAWRPRPLGLWHPVFHERGVRPPARLSLRLLTPRGASGSWVPVPRPALVHVGIGH